MHTLRERDRGTKKVKVKRKFEGGTVGISDDIVSRSYTFQY